MNTCLIPLGSEKFAIIDEADLPLVAGRNWHALEAPNGRTYAWTRGKRIHGTIYMHRLIDGTPADMDTDHINSNGLDNRRANLRSATRSQNLGNMRKPTRRDGTHPSSIYKGVSWDKARSKWAAGIYDGRQRSLGRFDSEADAARAYDAAALTKWGEFARLNFPATADTCPATLGNEIPNPLDERYDPSPEPIARKVS